MGNPSSTPRSFWLTLLTFTIIVYVRILRVIYSRLTGLQADLTHSTWSGMILLCLAISGVCIWLMLRDEAKPVFPKSLLTGFERLHFDNFIWRVLGAIIFLAIMLL